jgi:hypothetical protein
MKILLIWGVMLATANGPQTGEIKDPTPFATMEDCREFGKAMKERMADRIRGLVGTPWDYPVSITVKCQPEERGA